MEQTTLLEKITGYFQDGSWIEHIQPFLLNIGLALLIYIVGSWIASQLSNGLNKIMSARKFDIELQQFLDRITRTALKFVVVIVAVNQLGVDTTSLLALFGAAGLGIDGATIAGAVALAIGIGIQNFPEGFAVAMPLRRHGVSRLKSFYYGQLSAIVEPVFAVLGAIAVLYMEPILPFALSFAAGAMIYVVVEEVIPETQRDKYTDLAVLGFIGGFLIMMILDVGLS